jgi:hypothetical protein
MSSGLAGIECSPADEDITWQQFLEEDGKTVAKVLLWLLRL